MIVACPSCSKEYTLKSEHFLAPKRKVRCGVCQHCWVVAQPVPVNNNIAEFEQKREATQANVSSMAAEQIHNESVYNEQLVSQGISSEGTLTDLPENIIDFDAFSTNDGAVFDDNTEFVEDNDQYKKKKIPLDWVLLGSAIILLTLGLIFKGEILHSFGTSLVDASVWDSLKSGVNNDLSITDVSHELVLKDNESQLIIGATLINSTNSAKTIPDLTITAWDECPGVDGKFNRRCSVNSWTHTIKNQQVKTGEPFTFRVLFPFSGVSVKGAEVKFKE